MNTKLEYRLAPAMTRARARDPILLLKGMATMADYHFRVNAERLGVDPLSVATRFDWEDGSCRFVIEAPASEETLTLALDQAVQLVGLRADRLA